MSEKDKKGIDPELEKFLRENKEMVKKLFKEEKDIMERLFKEEKECIKNVFEEERSRAEKSSEGAKSKAKETAQEMFSAFTDPEVQKHVMAMGMEFLMAMNALISAMPFPDSVKDMAGKAAEARKKAAEDRSSKPGRSGGPKAAAPEKIEIKTAPKKQSKPRTPPAAKEKTSD